MACTPSDDALCTGMTPVCDEADYSCRGCRYHRECPASACNVFTGACLTAPPVVVGTAAGDLATAIGAAPAEAILVVQPGAQPYTLDNIVVSGKVIAILAQSGRPRLQGINNGPTLTVNNNTTVLLQGVDITLNGSAVGLQVSGQLALDEVTVRQNSQGGLNATSSSNILARNSIIAGNGNSMAAIALGGGTLELLYSSVASELGTGSAISCASSPTLTVRNSIVFTEGAAMTLDNCNNATITYSSLDESQAGMGNDMFTVDTSQFEGLSQGNLRLTGTGQTTFSNVARWRSGDPSTDIDGAARPSADMSQDVAGAHLGP